MLLATGAATRAVPPADEVLTFFGYGSSPFYTALPAAAAPAATEPSTTTSVCWLRHRHARAPSDPQRAADEGRLLLLRDLYDEALAQERLQRGVGRWSFPWAAEDD